MRPRRLVLVRHGESQWNASGILQGHRGPGLTERGHAQAEVTARQLARRFGRPELIARSDLPRVAETAAPSEERGADRAVVDQRLREIDLGWWAGKTHDQVAAQDPVAMDAWLRGEDVRRGGGETFAEVRRRMTIALDELAATLPAGATMFVFSHGGPIRVTVAEVLGVSSARGDGLAAVENCSISVVELRGRDRVLVSYNATDHLDDLVTSGVVDDRLRA